MRNLIIMFLMVGIATGQAQVIQLDEAKVNAKAVKIGTNGDLRFSIVEEYTNEFLKNPIGFMNENFDINEYIDLMKYEGFESYRVEFTNRKGYLVANFDDKGTLLNTAQRFKDIAVPLAIAKKLLKDHKGWAMTKNIYTASGNGDLLDKELYKITLKNGKDTRRVKIIPERPSRGLAIN